MPIGHVFLVVSVAAVWGTNFVVAKRGLDVFPPFLFLVLRFLFSAFPWVFIVPQPKVPGRAWILLGLLIGPGQFGLLFYALQHDVTPGLASVLVQAQVVFTLVLSRVFQADGLSSARKAALSLAALGIVVIALEAVRSASAAVTLTGVALCLSSAFLFAVTNILVPLAERGNALGLIAWSSAAALGPLVVISLSIEGPQVIERALLNAPTWAWGVVLWQSLGNTLFAYGAWSWLLKRHSVAVVAPASLLIPVFGLAASAIFLSEPLPWWKLGASALVLAGLALNFVATRAGTDNLASG